MCIPNSAKDLNIYGVDPIKHTKMFLKHVINATNVTFLISVNRQGRKPMLITYLCTVDESHAQIFS